MLVAGLAKLFRHAEEIGVALAHGRAAAAQARIHAMQQSRAMQEYRRGRIVHLPELPYSEIYRRQLGMTVGQFPEDAFTKIEKEAREELDEELSEAAKGRIKNSLKRIRDAEKVVANLKLQHVALMADIRSEV